MRNILLKILRKLKFIRGFFPKKLPSGMKDMEEFTSDIFFTYGLPNLPSYKNAIATIIMHLGPTTAYKAPLFFYLSVYKSMANQTAYEVIQSIREENKAKEEKEKAESNESVPNEEV